MIITTVNIAVCLIGLSVGFYTFAKHLNAFSQKHTPAANAWLVAVGMLAWSVALLASIDGVLQSKSWQASDLGLSTQQTLSHVLMLIFWCGSLLQVQKHCLRLKLKRRRKSAS